MARKSVSTKPRVREFTLRQLKYKKNRLLGMSQYNAAVAAGYSPNTAVHACRGPERVVKSSLVDEFNQAGLTDRVIAKELTRIGTAAVKIQSCQLLVRKDKTGKLTIEENANDFIEVDDNPTRIKALELASKLTKRLSDQPILDQSEHTYFTVVVAGDPGGSNGRSQTHPEAELSLSLTDQS